MIYKNQIVARPDNTKILVKNGNKYVYLVLGKKYIKVKRYVVEDRVLIGVLSNEDELKMHPNDKYFIHFPNKDIDLLESKSDFSDTISRGQFLVVSKIFKDIHLEQIINEFYPLHSDLIKALSTYYIDSQSMVSQLFSKWAYRNYSGIKSIPSNGTISNLFNKYISEESVDKFVFSWAKHSKLLLKNDAIFMSVDSTNFNINSKNISIAEYGIPKVNEGLPQVNLSLAMNQENYMPMFYDLYMGSTTDQTHCKKVVELCNEFGYENITLVLDRGYFSMNNVDFIEKSDYKYVIMAKSYNKLLQKLIEENRNTISDNPLNFIENEEIYAMQFKTKVFTTSSKKYNVYLFFSLNKKKMEFDNYMLTLKMLRKQIKNIKYINDDILKTYKNYFDFKYDENNKIISIDMNKEKYDKFYKNSGFFIIVSNQNYTPEKVLEIYKRRDVIEKAFRVLKTNLDFNKTYSQNTESLKAKTLISFISSIIRSRIYEKCLSYLRNHSGATFNTIFSELSKIEVYKINNVFKFKYMLTTKQKEILNLLEIDENFISDSLIKLNKNII